MLKSVSETTLAADLTVPRVIGNLADVFAGADSKPALILNREASTADVLAWCVGEAYALDSVAELLVAARGADSYVIEEAAALILHRTGPLKQVLDYLANRINTTPRQEQA